MLSIMRSAPLASLILAVLVALPATAAAQIVSGRVVEEGTDLPVSAAFVTLVDAAGQDRASGLAGQDGVFRLRAPAPGRYRLRSERIGYRSITSELLDVPVEGLEVTLEVPGDAVVLSGLRVEGEGRCVLRPEEGEATYILWEEARKALQITEWTSAEERVLFQVARFDRTLDPVTLVVEAEEVELLGVVSEQPFVTTSPDTLLEEGFIRIEEDRIYYDGVDAATILRSDFLDTHCFRRITGGSALAGLAFQPVDVGGITDVEGTLWVDRETAELRFLEFRYVDPPRFLRRVDPEEYGGRVEFRRLDDGSWIVSRWVIRTPVLDGTGFRARLVRYSESEGEILALIDRHGQPLPWTRHAAVLTGQVVHPRWGDPIPLATVRIVGAPYQVQADEHGRFGIDGLPGGRYRIEALHPSLPGGSIDRVVELSRGATTRIEIGG